MTRPKLRLAISLVGEIEAVDVQLLTVDDHHLAVITDEVARRAADRGARVQQPLLELAQSLLAASVGMGNQRPHRHPTANRSLDGFFQRLQVKAEDDDVDGFPGAFNRCHDRVDPVRRLHNELHETSVVVRLSRAGYGF